MQALQAPEACISGEHQRDRVRAFIVVMDGQMPNWEKLLMFSHLALWLPLENCAESYPGRMFANHRPGIVSFLSLTPPTLWFGAANPRRTESLELDGSCVPPLLFPSRTCANDSEGLQTATTCVI